MGDNFEEYAEELLRKEKIDKTEPQKATKDTSLEKCHQLQQTLLTRRMRIDYCF